MDSGELCLLCKKDLSVGATVTVTRGLDTIINSSIRRKDGVDGQLEGLSSLCIHTACRKSYTRESSIMSVIHPSPKKVKTLRSSLQPFDFTLHCMFCGDECDKLIDKKKPIDKRDIYDVRSLSCKESILNAASARNDEWGHIVSARLKTVIDLVAAEAKYHNSCFKKFLKLPSSRKAGRPEDGDISVEFELLFSFLKENDECQYSLEELLEKLREFLPNYPGVCSEKTLRQKLIYHFGEDVIITSLHGRKAVACFRDTGFKILSSPWYTQKSLDPKEERLRIVKAAAAIVREDIRSLIYKTDEYIPPDTAFENVMSVVPETLKVFVNDVINKRKKGVEDDKTRKCAVISHAIISATRPISFLSMIQVGLSSYIHRHVGSRHLVDILFSMGMCASYAEARRYEASAMLQEQPAVQSNAFMQFVFDNADFNVRTLTGYGTFHSMGGIMCVTPKDAITIGVATKRIETLPSALTAGQFRKVKLQTYIHSNSTSGISGVKVEDINNMRNLRSTKPADIVLGVLWMCGSWLKLPTAPTWNGYMELVTKSRTDYQMSRVIMLPFVNLQPTSLDAIYTVLTFASEECNRQGQHTCVVTFDQPLYAKAAEMVESAGSDSELSSVVVRLGGFHLLMSFMGAVGYIMSGSGLKDMWSLIYATDSIDKMLTGHSFARALRAHYLTQAALAIVFMNELGIDQGSCAQIASLYSSVTNETQSTENVTNSPVLNTLIEKLDDLKLQASTNSRTAKLWVQYFDQVTLMREFVSAERCGDWELHLETIRKMIPHFHASGHLAYAKYAHLYLQQMSHLDEKMTPAEFHRFSSMGNFTVRSSDKMWAGVWSDMTIEQVLMRSMKTSGGLTRGRGMTDSVLNRWVLGMPGCAELSRHFEDFCGVCFTNSEQHVELRKSRQLRDKQDIETLSEWLSVHSPMPNLSELMSIASGVVADNSINCDIAVEIGTEAMNKLTGMTFGNVQLHRKDRVLPLATVSNSVKVREEIIPVNTMQLFNRIICVIKSDEDFASCLEYELAPRPLSLFDDISMRKTEKAVMYRVIESYATCEQNYPTDSMFVVDGGYLLRRVVWPQHGTYIDLYDTYVSYVQRHYGTTSYVIFDGYSNNPSTKSVEQTRRAKKAQSTDILFTDDMPITIRQDRFLTSGANKSRLIKGLTQKMEAVGIRVKTAEADADTMIVSTAMELSHHENVVIVGTDSDLLILLSQLSKPDNCLYLLKPGSGSNVSKVYDITRIQSRLPEGFYNNLFFLHAMTGCDTTSALYRQGKKKAFKMLVKRPDLQKCVDVFNDPSSSENSVASAGEEFILGLYGAPMTTTCLNTHRYHCFMKAVAKCPIHTKLQLASLSPTSAAAKQHSLRVYHQVQQWLGRDLPATEWGWNLVNGQLQPILTCQPPAPDALLNLISCNCKTGCERGCGCRKAGIHCSLLCGQCRGGGCTNSEKPETNEQEDDHAISETQQQSPFVECEKCSDSESDDDTDIQEPDLYSVEPTASTSMSL